MIGYIHGLTADVYKNANQGNYDCTANGLTNRHTVLTIVAETTEEGRYDDEEIAAIVEASEGRPNAAVVVRREALRGNVHYWPNWDYVLPVEVLVRKVHSVFGGNYVSSSDSRPWCLVSGKPLPVHDRVES